MSFAEFLHWQEFFAAEPPLSERVDLAGALISSVVANVNRSPDREPVSVEDFMVVRNSLRDLLKGKVAKAEREAEETIAADDQLRMFILQMGGKVS
jgi:hypothetical protein